MGGRVELVDDLLDGGDRRASRQHGLLLHTGEAPQQNVAVTVRLLGVDHGHVRSHRAHRAELLPGERAVDEGDLVVSIGEVRARIAAQDPERQPRGAGGVRVGQPGVRVLSRSYAL